MLDVFQDEPLSSNLKKTFHSVLLEAAKNDKQAFSFTCFTDYKKQSKVK